MNSQGSDPIYNSTLGLDAPRERGLTSRMTAIAEILLCSSVPTQFLIGSLLRQAGWSPLDEAGQLSLPFVLALSVADTLLLLGLMVVLTRAHGERVGDLWLGRRSVRSEAVYGLLLIPVVFLLVVVLLNVLRTAAPSLHNVPTNPLEQLAGTPGQAAMFAVVAIVAGGVREELQRAFLLRRFEQHLGGVGVGVVVLSIGFGLGHLVQGWDAVVTTGLLGAGWAVLYLRRRSTVAPLVSHAGFNALEVLRVAITGA
ncbi:MAG: CPBP family intramembrane metalloprotease [Acidobacteria bacterium]|nr:CPBP family intramembrane metalloprotease [Acidobacteriota bacterium]